MRFFIGNSKITPEFPVLQCGFAARNKKSEGVHDDTYASVVIMQENETVVIITLDVVYGDKSFAYGIKTSIKEKFDIPSQNIIISYTHTHSSVALTGEDITKRNRRPYSLAANKFFFYGEWKNIDDSKDVAYYQYIKEQIITLMDQGISNLTEGSIHINKSNSKFGISRRLPVNGKIEFRPFDNDDVMDTDLFLLKLTDSKGTVKGIIYNYACHPTSVGSDNYLISADFPGEVRTQLKEIYPNTEVVFLQGCGADIKPRFGAVDGYFKSANFSRLKNGCKNFVKEISTIINSGIWKEINLNLKTAEKEFLLYTNKKDKSFFEAIYNNPDEAEYRRESALASIENIDNNNISETLPFYINAIYLDNTTCLLALENEVVSDIGKLIKAFSNDDLIVLGYSNSVCCYIPTEDIIKNGGYEGENYMIARLAGPFVPEIESIIVGESLKLLKTTNSSSEKKLKMKIVPRDNFQGEEWILSITV